MATTIVTKNGSGAPTDSDLVAGELAVDLTNGRLYTTDLDSGGTVIEIGLNPSGNVDVTGTVTADGLTTNGDIFINNAAGTVSAGYLYSDSDDFVLRSYAQDKDIVFKGNDSGSVFEAMRIDMSANGNVDIGSNATASAGASKQLLSLVNPSGTTSTAARLWMSGTNATTRGAYIEAEVQSTGNDHDLIFATSASGAAPSEAMRIDGSGNLLVGTTSNPVTSTSVFSKSGGGASITVGDIGTPTNRSEIFWRGINENRVGWDSSASAYLTFHNGSERMRIDSSGNVGIGAVPANGRLHVTAASGVVGWFETTGLSGALGISNSGTFGMQIDTASSSGFLTFTKGSGTTEFGRFDTSGNLLVGKTATSFGTDGFQANADGQIWATNASASVTAFNRRTTDGAISVFYKDGTTVGSIGAVSGDLGIGNGTAGLRFFDQEDSVIPYNETTQASDDNIVNLGRAENRFKNLYLSGTANVGSAYVGTGAEANLIATFAPSTGGNAEFRNTSSTGTFTFTTNNGSSEAMRISGGNLLVGRSSASAPFTDNGHVFYGTGQHYIFSNATECVRFYETSGSGQQVGSISITSSATAFNTSSDQRLKENIVDAPSASDDIDAIRVRSFDWKADGSHQKYGMVAQELQTVAPEAVSVPEDPEEMMGVDYSKLVPMMLKEIQSLRARVAQLES